MEAKKRGRPAASLHPVTILETEEIKAISQSLNALNVAVLEHKDELVTLRADLLFSQRTSDEHISGKHEKVEELCSHIRKAIHMTDSSIARLEQVMKASFDQQRKEAQPLSHNYAYIKSELGWCALFLMANTALSAFVVYKLLTCP